MRFDEIDLRTAWAKWKRDDGTIDGLIVACEEESRRRVERQRAHQIVTLFHELTLLAMTGTQAQFEACQLQIKQLQDERAAACGY